MRIDLYCLLSSRLIDWTQGLSYVIKYYITQIIRKKGEREQNKEHEQEKQKQKEVNEKKRKADQEKQTQKNDKNNFMVAKKRRHKRVGVISFDSNYSMEEPVTDPTNNIAPMLNDPESAVLNNWRSMNFPVSEKNVIDKWYGAIYQDD